jgi:Prohead core protein serine protease
MMKLITENIEDIQVLTEEADGKKNYYIEGIFLQGDLTNRNGRNYPVNILEREVTKYNENFVGTGRALGELGHPDGPTINLDRVSHKILSLQREGNNFIGKAKLLETPMGKIAKSLLDDGVKLGVSSRGLGSMTEKNGVNYVGEDFMLATAADIVADPSAPDAFVDGIMEGKEWVWENGILKESAIAAIKNEIDQSTLINLQERKVKAFAAFLRSL